MKVNFRIPVTLLIGILFVLPVKSQVTIGMQYEPLKGSLLDLKQSNETNGDADSKSGLMMARISLSGLNSLSPILSESEPNYDNLKQSYTGLIVYNVNTTPPLVKGLYIWEGAAWEQLALSDLETENGLNLAGEDTIQLGGVLDNLTDFNLGDYNLNFDRTNGNIGIDIDNPQAIMHIANNDSSDPMILNNLNFAVNDPSNIYYKLQISENGVLRKSYTAPLYHESVSYVYNLKGDVQETTTTGYTQIDSNNDTDITWIKDGNIYTSITLPESGSYAFSFRFYGQVDGPANASSIFYLYSLKNGDVYNRTEMLISRVGTRLTMASRLVATYTVNVTVTGTTGDQVGFRMGQTPGGGLNWWRLRERPVTRADRTSMFFWKI